MSARAFEGRRPRSLATPIPLCAGLATQKGRGAVATTRRPKLQSGAVTVVQRTNSDFRLNPHLHAIALDGVFVEQPDGSPPRFEQLPHLKTIEVAEVATAVRTRVIQLLVRRGVIEDSTQQLVLLPDDQAEQQPVLAQ
ncbi:MAG: transposase, partial [Deltaproteobacteria bacterium]